MINAPPHIAALTHDEAKLAARFSDPTRGDVDSPRVQHDVYCIAATLTLRRGHRPSRIEDARAVFATTAPLVILNAERWWVEDEGESGIAPVVHIRSLANLAWLKKPRLKPDFQLRGLVALCGGFMRPSDATWRRFMSHLGRLRESGHLSTDEATVIISAALTDELLHDADVAFDDDEDIDASTLDEVVARVKGQYTEEAQAQIHEVNERHAAELVAASEQAHSLAEIVRRRELLAELRARRIVRNTFRVLYVGVLGLVLIATVAAWLSAAPVIGSLGLVVFVAGGVLAILQMAGSADLLGGWRRRVEPDLVENVRGWLLGDSQDPVN